MDSMSSEGKSDGADCTRGGNRPSAVAEASIAEVEASAGPAVWTDYEVSHEQMAFAPAR